ncbi:hypothetical protein D3C79_550540 [compost metagenome]
MSKAKAVRTPRVTIELGGKTRTIVYDLNAFAELELKYGSVDKAMQALQGGSVIAARNMLWAGLIHDEAILDEVTGEPLRYGITPYQVGAWLSATDIQTLGDLINSAMTQSIVQPDQKAKQLDVAAKDPSVASVELTEEEKAEQAKN